MEDEPEQPSSEDAIVEGLALGAAKLGSVPGAAEARVRTRDAMFGPTAASTRCGGRFLLGRRLGSGAMGTVYAAEDPRLNRAVAIKLLHSGPVGPDTERGRARLLLEARAMAQLTHPNVVTVYEVGLDDGPQRPAVFLAMEFVDGYTLRQWKRRAQPTWQEILRTYRQAGAGLAAVHAAGFVHRDFKPDNCMVDRRGRVLVMDFGLARGSIPSTHPLQSTTSACAALETVEGLTIARDAIESGLTRTGELVGTPAYMPPEQMEGLAAGAACDQYALCVALYEALCERRPFGGTTLTQLHASVLAGPPRWASEHRVPRRIIRAIHRGLRPEPADRFGSMDQLLEALSVPASRSSRRTAIAGSVGVAIAGTWVALHGPSEPLRCVEGALVVSDAWSPLHAQALRTGFASTSVPAEARIAARVVRGLDAYAREWGTLYDQTCGSTRSDLDKRMGCLSRRRVALGQLATILQDSGGTAVSQAEAAVAGLDPVQDCADSAYIALQSEPPSDAETAAKVRQIEKALAQVRALESTGDLKAALRESAPLVVRADDVGYLPLLAEVQFKHAELQFLAGSLAEATKGLEAAYLEARAASSRTTAIEAALALASLHATGTGDIEAAVRWRRAARAEVGEHPSPGREAQLLGIEADTFTQMGEYDAGLEAAKKHVALLEQSCPKCDELVAAHHSLAAILLRFAKIDQAVHHATLAVDLAVEMHPGDHDHVASAFYYLGQALDKADRPAEALAAWQRAFSIREAVLGPDSTNLAMTRASVGVGLAAIGRYDEAIEQMVIALEVLGPQLDGDRLAAIHNRLALVYEDAGRMDDARRSYRLAAEALARSTSGAHPALAVLLSNVALLEESPRDVLAGLESALEMRRATVEGHDPQQAIFLHNIAKTLTKLGRTDEAIARLREATALTETGSIADFPLRLRLYLADLLWADDPAGAREVVRSARVRCGALKPAQQADTGCDRIAEWENDHE